MKLFKNSKVCSLILAVVLMLCTLTSCGADKLSGTYHSEGVIAQSVTFGDDNRITISAFGINANGTYQIEDDEIIITYTLMDLSYDLRQSFRRDGKSIFIDGTEFIKE